MQFARLSISVVLFENHPIRILRLLVSLKKVSIPYRVFFIDNSPIDSLSKIIQSDEFISYKHLGKNIGFGKAHNEILKNCLDKGDYHLVLNPDVYFFEETIEKIVKKMDNDSGIGLLLPKVLNPDFSNQKLYKLLPKPSDLIFRRFLPEALKGIWNQMLNKYSLNDANPNYEFEAPYLSGCFMFIRKAALKEVGVFDTRFFLYCEDIDLSRRINSKWKTLYWPKSEIFHFFNKGSYKSIPLMVFHIVSAIKYFNKYGWFIDKARDKVNKKTLEGMFEKQNLAIPAIR